MNTENASHTQTDPPADAKAYHKRGIAYHHKGEIDRAIQDFNTAIDLNPQDAYVYQNRSWVWLYLSEWEKAKADLITTINLGVDIVSFFDKAHGNVAGFEAKLGRQVPADIAALLSGD